MLSHLLTWLYVDVYCMYEMKLNFALFWKFYNWKTTRDVKILFESINTLPKQTWPEEVGSPISVWLVKGTG